MDQISILASILYTLSHLAFSMISVQIFDNCFLNLIKMVTWAVYILIAVF